MNPPSVTASTLLKIIKLKVYNQKCGMNSIASRRSNAHAFYPWRGLSSCLITPLVVLSVMFASCTSASVAQQTATTPERITLFPMTDYDQNADRWIDPSRSDYDSPFLSLNTQRAHGKLLFARYFGSSANDPSPWNPTYIETYVYRNGDPDISKLQQTLIDSFDNTGKPEDKLVYGQNFRPHTKAWIDAIAHNVDVDQFSHVYTYVSANRAITTGNTLVRLLPSLDPSFYDYRIGGEGYPFDNFQITAPHPGTPVYVIGSSRDGAWRYVQTPDVRGWVRSGDIGMVDAAFVARWRSAALKRLGAVVDTSTPVRDTNDTFRFIAPIGTLLPIVSSSDAGYDVLVPARTVNGKAVIRTARLSDTQIVSMPWPATPRHIATLIKALIGRPYAWGNLNFYNDCSSELQSMFAPFGIWLPRRSSAQMSVGQVTDLSTASPAERIDYLVNYGRPMRTLVYIGGHVMLYLGNTTYDGKTVPLTYQDIWGLSPKDNSRRAVIGGSAILPLLPTIPEDPALISLAAKPIFKVSILGGPN